MLDPLVNLVETSNALRELWVAKLSLLAGGWGQSILFYTSEYNMFDDLRGDCGAARPSSFPWTAEMQISLR